MARVVAFHAGGITNEGNVLAPANTRPDQTLTLKIEGKMQMSRAMATENFDEKGNGEYALTEA